MKRLTLRTGSSDLTLVHLIKLYLVKLSKRKVSTTANSNSSFPSLNWHVSSSQFHASISENEPEILKTQLHAFIPDLS